MVKIAELLDRWSSRAANAVALLPLIPAGIIGVLSAIASTGVEGINQYGWFGWLWAGLSAFAVTSIALALLGRTRIWRIDARLRERVIGDSSPFDPMARVYENKRLYLRDLAPVGRRQVIGKKFINCEIIGPGTAVLGIRSSESKPIPKMDACRTFDVDCIEMDPQAESALAIGFADCDFEGCKFYHMTLLFFSRENDTLNWITPDYRQPVMIPAPAPSASTEGWTDEH